MAKTHNIRPSDLILLYYDSLLIELSDVYDKIMKNN